MASPLWMPYAQQYPVKYKNAQMPMEAKPYGVVMHTTNAAKGEQSIKRFQADWQALQNQSAHFVIDRSGVIGQCRALNEVAWHMNSKHSYSPKYPSKYYFGIEFIAQHKDINGITHRQKESAIRLIGDLSSLFGFPVQRLNIKGKDKKGVGLHGDFEPTICSEGIFWTGKIDHRTEAYDTILSRAKFYASFGY